MLVVILWCTNIASRIVGVVMEDFRRVKVESSILNCNRVAKLVKLIMHNISRKFIYWS